MDACAWQDESTDYWREVLYDMGWALPLWRGGVGSINGHLVIVDRVETPRPVFSRDALIIVQPQTH